MAGELPADIWFVRTNGGLALPVKPEGWRVINIFVAGFIVSIVLALFLAVLGSAWLWIAVLLVGMASSAWYLISMVRKHRDPSMTFEEFVRSAGGQTKV
jgi:hypothetical protein